MGLCHMKGFPAMRLGRKWLINRDLLKAWLEQQAGNK
ncbi:MAG: helix-turn-helix domain-containing protein [Desulfotomaculales bacterium]